MNIDLASKADLEGIMALQAMNQADHGGTLTVSLPYSKVAWMLREMPLIIARRNDSITGFLMTSTRAMNEDVPIISAMLAKYPGTADAYIYGPICVSIEERGKGLALPFTHKSRHRTLAHGSDQGAVCSQWLFHWQAPQRGYGPCARIPFGRAARRPSAALRSLAMEQPLRRRARLAYDHRATRCGATCG